MTHRFRFVLVLIVAGFFAFAVYNHSFNVNSEHYFIWFWQSKNPATVYPLMLASAIPFFAGQIIYERRPKQLWLAIGLCMISMLALMIAGAVVQKDPPSFTRISDIIRSRMDNGYFRGAIKLRREGIGPRQLLARYPALLGNFYLHPRTKPPGLIMLEMAITRLLGSGTSAAMFSGLLIGFVATFSIPAIYLLIKLLTGNWNAAFLGASYCALSPAPVLFFPDFDQCYPILTVGIVACWVLALRRNQARYAIALGFAYALTTFITYLPAVMVFFLAAFALYQYLALPECGLMRIFRYAAISLGTFTACYVALWLMTGFNFIATLRECLHQQNVLWKLLYPLTGAPQRKLPGTIPADLYDFALGSGWISYVLVGFSFVSARTNKRPADFWIAVLCVVQFVCVAVSGLIQTETARVWLFMYPLLMIPIGLELVYWSSRQRIAVYLALLLITAVICQSLMFLNSMS